MRRVELRVPGVGRQPDVVPERRERRRVELDARVDAVVRRAVRLVRVEGESRGVRVTTGGRARETTVVECNADRPVVGDGEVGLELVHGGRVVVHLDRRRPRLAAVVRRGHQHVVDACAVVLVRDVQRIRAVRAGMVADRERVLDPIPERRVRVRQRGRLDVAHRHADRRPGLTAVRRRVDRDGDAAVALLRIEVGQRRVQAPVRGDVREQVRHSLRAVRRDG